jgi:hypothetical protein
LCLSHGAGDVNMRILDEHIGGICACHSELGI